MAKRSNQNSNYSKDSEEYRIRRERNNEAVKKCRATAKQRMSKLEKQLAELKAENEIVRKKWEEKCQELKVTQELLHQFVDTQKVKKEVSPGQMMM